MKCCSYELLALRRTDGTRREEKGNVNEYHREIRCDVEHTCAADECGDTMFGIHRSRGCNRVDDEDAERQDGPVIALVRDIVVGTQQCAPPQYERKRYKEAQRKYPRIHRGRSEFNFEHAQSDCEEEKANERDS